MTPCLNRLCRQRIGVQDGFADAGAIVVVAEAEKVVGSRGGVDSVAGGEPDSDCM